MNKINKKRKYAYAAITSTVLAIVVIIIVNMIASTLSVKVSLSMDFTRGGILDFSEETEKALTELDMDVNVISLLPENDYSSDALHIDEVLKKYATYSDKLHYKRVDARKNPSVLTNYSLDGQPLENGYNIIVESERMYTVVSVNDIFEIRQHTNMKYGQSALSKAEEYFTNAILKVTKGSEINVYVLTGRGESYDAEFFKTQFMAGSGYTFKELSLFTDSIPDDANLLIITHPSSDYTIEEINKLDEYMMNGGNIQVFLDTKKPDLPNLFDYCREWGIEVGSGLVCDDNTKHFAEVRSAIIPVPESNETAKELVADNTTLLFMNTRPLVTITKVGRDTTVIASTSDDGYIKQNPKSEFDVFESGDEYKKSNIAVISEFVTAEGDVSALYVSGSEQFFNRANNSDFYNRLVAYMTKQPSLYITEKLLLQERLFLNQSSVYLYALVVIFVIPIIILVMGFIIWIKRRHL